MIYQTSFINPREMELISEKIYLKDGKIYINDKVIIDETNPIKITLHNSDVDYHTFYKNNNNRKILGGIRVKEFKLTETSKLILPLFFNSKKECLLNYILVNAYKSISNFDNDKDSIYLVYRWLPFYYYDDYIKLISKHPFYNSLVKSKDSRFDIVEFKIKDLELLKDINKIYEGNYHYISDESKIRIIQFNNLSRHSILFKVLTNNKKYRTKMENELNCHIPNSISLKEKINLKYEEFCNS